MKNLGRVVLLIVWSSVALFARIEATLDNSVVYSGDMVTYQLTISGSDIQKPNLLDICGNEIVATGSQTSIESINGNYSKTYTLSYQFMPQSSCTIKPVELKIDGKIEKSNSVNFVVKEPSQDKSAPFLLTLKSSKSSLYVGEPFELTLTLEQDRAAHIVDNKFIAPDFKGVWLKSESKPSRVESDEKIVTTVVYTLAPQREGNISIAPAQLRVASRVSGANSWGSFAPQVKWKSYYSNKPTLEVKAIPNDAKIIGDFTIEAKVAKKEIHPNEALNLTLSVEGVGNLEDIKSFKPYVQGVNVFDEKSVVDGDKLTQKLAFVAEKDFVIPAFELVYFSTKTQKLRKIKTEPIEIKVIGGALAKELNIERAKDEEIPKVQEKESQKVVVAGYDKLTLAFAFIFGVLVGVALMSLRLMRFKKQKSSFDIKDEKLLMMKLLPFKEDKEVQELMDILEKNAYSKEKKSIDKKRVKEILKRHSIS